MLRRLRQIYLKTLQTLDSERLVVDALSSSQAQRLDVLALGKAAVPMACGAHKALGEALDRGFLVTKDDHLSPSDRSLLAGKFQLREAAHPVPNQAGIQATLELKDWLKKGRAKSLLVMLSGGTSSLLVAPSPPLELEHLEELNSALLASGLPIEIINILRKHLSSVKGGQLAKYCAAHYDCIEQMLMVDICAPDLAPQDVLSLVGSGPFLGDSSTLSQAKAVLSGLRSRLSEECFNKAQSALVETPETTMTKTTVLASHLSVHASAREHLQDNYRESEAWSSVVSGEVQDLALKFVKTGKELQAQGLRGVLVACGEPTVTLDCEDPGMGGRCQELALHVAKLIAGESGLTFLAGSTDGTDGPSPYAGAVVDGKTWPNLCRLLGTKTAEAGLKQHESSSLLEQLPQTHLKTGPTGQNLNDLFLLALGAC